MSNSANRLCRAVFQTLLLSCLTPLWLNQAQANFNGCGEDLELSQSFSSGATWQLCASVSEQHGLDVSSVHYRAPGDTSRSVLFRAHAAQILMHYHDETDPRAQLGNSDAGRLLPITSQNCDGTILSDSRGEAALCSQVQDNGILAKFGQTPAIQSQQWVLSSALQRNGLTWATSITFAEDGQITPAVSLSGRGKLLNTVSSSAEESAQSLASATVLSTWRMIFNLDDGNFDQIHQFDFVLNEQMGNQRPMQVTAMPTETFTRVNREQFRGWLVSDSTGTGFYLDPSNSGYGYVNGQHNWANFDVALTRHNDCELYAMQNIRGSSADTAIACGTSLDDFVNNESLQGGHPVLWFSQSRSFTPSSEHWPAISNLHQSFTLLPYEWTAASPFEAPQ